jgi:hypothetical protein
LSWDLDEALTAIGGILQERDELSAVADRAREAFRRAWDANGRAAFCDRLRVLLSGAAPALGQA